MQAPAVLALQFRLQGVQARHQRRGLGALRDGQLGSGVVIIGDDFTHRAQGIGERLLDGVIGIKHRLLRHERQAQRMGAVHRAGIGQQIAGQQLEERGFTAAVASHQGEPLTGFDLQRRLVQQRYAVKGQRHLFKGKNCHRVSIHEIRAREVESALRWPGSDRRQAVLLAHGVDSGPEAVFHGELRAVANGGLGHRGVVVHGADRVAVLDP